MRLATILTVLVFAFSIYADMSVSIASQNQTDPQAVGMSSKTFVAWNDTRAGTGNMNIYGNIINAAGSLVGPDVALCVNGSQQYDVVVAAGAKFVAAWLDQRVSDSIPEVFARQVNDDGTTPLVEFQCTSTGNAKLHTAANSIGNDILVVFEEITTSRKIRGQRLAWSGTTYSATGSTFNISTLNYGTNPDVATGSTNYLVVWADTILINTGLILGQRVSTTGTLVGDTVVIATYPSPFYPQKPSVTWDGTQWFVVWHEYVSGPPAQDNNIYGRFVNSSGDATGSVMNLALNTQAESNPDVAWDGIGFFAMWQDTRAAYTNLYGKRIVGGSIGAEEIVTTGSYNESNVTAAWNGTYYDICWQDWRSGSTWDIYAVRKSQTPWAGPTALAIRPPDGGASSCVRQQVVMYLHDSDGINTSTIKFIANGTPYHIGAQLTYSADTLRFTPPSDWPLNTNISCCLDSARDMTGLNIASPVCCDFMIDITDPVWGTEFPLNADTANAGAITLTIGASDANCGISTDSMGFQVMGTWYYYGSSTAVGWNGTTMSFNSSAIGVRFDPFASYTVCAKVRDRAMYCASNEISKCWMFYTTGNKIYGHVWLFGMSDHSGITVDARRGDSLWSDVTDVSGNYSIPGVQEVSEIVVTAYKTGWADSSVTIDMSAGGAVNVNFRLFPIVMIYSSDFEANDGALNDDLRYGGPFHYDWEWGVPTDGPGAAHSGTKCWATKLTTDYSDSSRSRLKTAALMLPPGTAPTISWWQWYRFQAPTRSGYTYSWHDGGNIKLWLTLTDSTLLVPDRNYDTTQTQYNFFIPRQRSYADTGNGEYWHRVSVNLAAWAGQTVYISWDFGSSTQRHDSGWFIDDVQVGYVDRTYVEDDFAKPDNYGIEVYPNPFNATCSIVATGSVEIFDIMGRKVGRLESPNSGKNPSEKFKTVWDGSDFSGKALPSGVYFAKLAGKSDSVGKKIILMR